MGGVLLWSIVVYGLYESAATLEQLIKASFLIKRNNWCLLVSWISLFLNKEKTSWKILVWYKRLHLLGWMDGWMLTWKYQWYCYKAIKIKKGRRMPHEISIPKWLVSISLFDVPIGDNWNLINHTFVYVEILNIK